MSWSPVVCPSCRVGHTPQCTDKPAKTPARQSAEVKALTKQLADAHAVIKDLREMRSDGDLWSVSVDAADSDENAPFEFICRAKAVDDVLKLATNYMRDAYDSWDDVLRLPARLYRIVDDRMGVLIVEDAIEREVVLFEEASVASAS